MTVYKRLLQADENQIELLNPISVEEIQARDDEYPLLTPKRFGFNRSKEAFKPIKFGWKGQIHEIQYNTCGNPLCKNHSLPQERFNIKSKPYRYIIDNGRGRDDRRIICNPERVDPESIPTQECKTSSVSNWSLAE